MAKKVSGVCLCVRACPCVRVCLIVTLSSPLSQGCIRDLRLNGRYVPLDGQSRDGVSLVSSQGLSLGCSSDSCKRNQCSPPFTCVARWGVRECRDTGWDTMSIGVSVSCNRTEALAVFFKDYSVRSQCLILSQPLILDKLPLIPPISQTRPF